MERNTLFLLASILFACGWGAVAILYFFKVIPVIKRRRGWKTLLEAGLQLNFPRHISDYGRIAKEEHNQPRLVVFYSINALVILSAACLLCGLFTCF
jgi:hypothetical protein